LDTTDVASWRATAIILVTISIIFFLIERFWQPILDPAFELFIIDFPAAFSILLYLWLRRRERHVVDVGGVSTPALA